MNPRAGRKLFGKSELPKGKNAQLRRAVRVVVEARQLRRELEELLIKQVTGSAGVGKEKGLEMVSKQWRSRY